MEKFTRNQRITIITKILMENPNKVINLNLFTKLFNAAKSTISEDIIIVREIMENMNMGNIETISGASGGIKYIGSVPEEEIQSFSEELCKVLEDKERVIPGNFIYITDIMYNPKLVFRAGKILAGKFKGLNADYVVTVETKGIPLAYEVAKNLGVQLVIVRRDNKVTEGPTVSINYVSGSTRRIQSMSLSKKSFKKGSKCIFIDDFMKAGGTALGIINLLKEFESELLGIGVLIDDIRTTSKLVEDYISLIQLSGLDSEGIPILNPSHL